MSWQQARQLLVIRARDDCIGEVCRWEEKRQRDHRIRKVVAGRNLQQQNSDVPVQVNAARDDSSCRLPSESQSGQGIFRMGKRRGTKRSPTTDFIPMK